MQHGRPKQAVEVDNILTNEMVNLRVALGTPDRVEIEVMGIAPFFKCTHGANSYKDSLLITKLAPYESQLVYFDKYQPKIQGTETLKISIDQDSNTLNNQITKDRVINYNVYSHADPFN